jgi:hypothetical protein
MLRNRGAAITATGFSPPESGAPGTAPAGAMTTLDMPGLAKQPPGLIIVITAENLSRQSAMPGCGSATTSAARDSVTQLQQPNFRHGSFRSRVSVTAAGVPSPKAVNRMPSTAPTSAVSGHGDRKRTGSLVRGCGSCWNSTPCAQSVAGTTGVRRARRSTTTTRPVLSGACCASAVTRVSVSSAMIRYGFGRRLITLTDDLL